MLGGPVGHECPGARWYRGIRGARARLRLCTVGQTGRLGRVTCLEGAASKG